MPEMSDAPPAPRASRGEVVNWWLTDYSYELLVVLCLVAGLVYTRLVLLPRGAAVQADLERELALLPPWPGAAAGAVGGGHKAGASSWAGRVDQVAAGTPAEAVRAHYDVALGARGWRATGEARALIYGAEEVTWTYERARPDDGGSWPDGRRDTAEVRYARPLTSARPPEVGIRLWRRV